ncbi:hypothetical protein ACWGBU_36635 [Streptomyces vinaceus]
MQKSVQLGSLHPDWTPPTSWTPDLNSIHAAHRARLEILPDGHRAAWCSGGGLFLIKNAHDAELIAYVSSRDDFMAGALTVHRTGGPDNTGYIQVQGVPRSRRDLVTATLT